MAVVQHSGIMGSILHPLNPDYVAKQGCRIVETLETCFQPLLNFGSHIWLAGPKAQPASQLWQPNLTGWARGPASQMAGTKPHGCDSAKCLQLSQMASNQPNGCDSSKWLGIIQMAATQRNGCSSAIWMGLSQVAGTQSNGCDSAKKLGISPKTGK